METFTALCLGFFWGCVITELCEKYKKKHKYCCSSSQTDTVPLEDPLLPKTEDIKEE